MNEGSFAFCATVLCSTFTPLSCDSAALCWKEAADFFKHNVIAGASVQSSPGGLFLPRERTGWKASVAVWFSLSSPVLVSPVRLDVSHYYFPSATWLVPSHALMMLFAKWIMWFHTAGWGAKRKRRGDRHQLANHQSPTDISFSWYVWPISLTYQYLSDIFFIVCW